MNAKYPLDFLLSGRFVHKIQKTSRMDTITFQMESRDEGSKEIEQLLIKNDIPYTQEHRSVSSFPVFEAVVNGKMTRIVFKPAKVTNTKLAESAQCVYCAAAQFARSDIDDGYVQTNINKFKHFFDVDETTENVLTTLNSTWKRSSIIIANHLRKKLRRQDYVFHRNSDETKKVYKKFAELNKAEGKVFFQSDKWNPADIWAIRRGFVVNLSQIKTLDQLNAYLAHGIDKGDIVPISLKMVTKVAKITTVNTNEAKAMPKANGPSAKVIAVKANTGFKDWMSSKNCKIVFMSGQKEMQLVLRSPYPRAPVNGELQQRGSAAQHGKVNMKTIHRVLTSLGATFRIPDQPTINRQSFNKDRHLIDQVYTLAVKNDKTSHVSRMDFLKFIQNTKDYDWLASKYGALVIIDAFQKLSPIKKNTAIDQLYSHGAASHDLSGPFLKVS